MGQDIHPLFADNEFSHGLTVIKIPAAGTKCPLTIHLHEGSKWQGNLLLHGTRRCYFLGLYLGLPSSSEGVAMVQIKLRVPVQELLTALLPPASIIFQRHPLIASSLSRQALADKVRLRHPVFNYFNVRLRLPTPAEFCLSTT